jgi:hypothetical protein
MEVKGVDQVRHVISSPVGHLLCCHIVSKCLPTIPLNIILAGINVNNDLRTNKEDVRIMIRMLGENVTVSCPW